jgi:CxxC-x17-CxxC domain-containing protein
MYADKTLTCVECGASFIFSADDQEFHAQKGFANEPKRCPSCRAARRAERGGNSGGGYYQSSPREMFTATCAQCGQEAQVPFQPRGDRPVYCNDCFQSQRGGGGYGGRRGGGGGNYSRNSGGGGRW